jgi:hypothetical protein
MDATRHVCEAEVHPNGLDLNVVRVELYADEINGCGPIRQEMTRGQIPAARTAWGDLYRVGPIDPIGIQTGATCQLGVDLRRLDV